MTNLFILTGCSKGLGKALLEVLLADAENMVVGISRSPMKGAGNFKHLTLDLTDAEELSSRLDELFPEGDYKKAVLINNAGWIGEIAPIGRLEPAGIAKIHAVNVIAPAILMNAFVQRFAMEPMEKTVVNISSGAAEKNMDGWSGYSSSKAALNRMTGVAQQESEMKGYGIRYFALSPGIVDTPMQEDIRATKQENFSHVEQFKSFKENHELTSPSAVAEKVVFLLDHEEEFDGVLQDVRKF
ncbi:short-chain dehydrogenase [Echinicola strongylocentroti]|uniref:Short-chain dehydrogenase n=1 Tax=Echinicola strongylocentroti TaxID=1795355 RepID=A0A2Z4IFD2_9BACT|nr:SDR family NAD(P)-dependent oxidoreductase [Echinicola strongylocentroti]AWW29792.1 short-chain dehydrogenase [Echinicola strongylocentroti]